MLLLKILTPIPLLESGFLDGLKGASLGRSFLDFIENYSSSLLLLLAIA